MFDYHMHSRVSFDGHDTGEVLAKAALEKGLKEICFTDHLDYDPLEQMGCMAFDTQAYNAEYDALEIPGLNDSKKLSDKRRRELMPIIKEQALAYGIGFASHEEIDEIIPAIEESRKEGLDVYGPLPPDTVFLKAYKGEYDLVVSMYHDQGHIPLKLMDFDSGVNITCGLPFIRTSVDHGTAFDIAGKNIARKDSLVKALQLARKLAE